MSPNLSVERRHVLVFLLIAFVVIAAGIGLREPWPADEPRFVLVAQQMVQSGDWWFPRRGIELYPDKPPLFMWMLGGAYLLVGSIRWSFLLPSLFAAMGTLWLTYDLGRRVWNPRVGLWAAAAVLVTPAFIYQAKRAQIDPVLVFLTTLALYGMLRHLLLGPAWRWLGLGAFAAGLGVWTKGVGFLPLLLLLPFALMRRAHWQGLGPADPRQPTRWFAALAMFPIAIAMWFVPMVLMALLDGDPAHRAYLDNLLFKQTISRYADAWHHHQPIWYFAEVVLFLWAPFSLAFFWLWRDWRDAWRRRDARIWLPLSWGILVIAFFTGSTGKRDMYILPALPAFALAAAPFLDALSQRRGFRLAVLGYVLLLSGVLLLAGGWALLGDPRFEARVVAERGLADGAQWVWWMLVVVGTIGIVAAIAGRVSGALRAAAMLLSALWIGWGVVVHPVLDDENSARAVMQAARRHIGPEATLGLVAWKEQNLLQLEGPSADFGFLRPREDQWAEAIDWIRADPGRRWIFANASSVPACIPSSARIAIGRSNRRDWILVDAAGVAACEPRKAPLRLPAT